MVLKNSNNNAVPDTLIPVPCTQTQLSWSLLKSFQNTLQNITPWSLLHILTYTEFLLHSVLRAKKDESGCFTERNRYIFCSYYLSPTVQCVWKAFSAQLLCGLLCPQVTGPLFSLLTVIFVIRQARLGNLLCSANRSQSSILLHTHTDAHRHTYTNTISLC